MRRQSFFQGTLILLVSGLITRLLGFIPKTILPRIIGTEGVGLYQMAFSILIFFLTLARFGLNVSISKIVAEAAARNDHVKIRKTLVLAVGIVISLSLILVPIAIYSSYLLSRSVFTDDRVIYPLLAMTPLIPIIAISTIFKGYFQGRQNMIPTAMSNVIEALVRIIAVVLITTLLLPYGVGIAAAGVMIGVGVGEIASLLTLLLSFQRVRNQLLHPTSIPFIRPRKISNAKSTFQELWSLSLPVTASGFVGSLSFAIEPVVVAQSLALAGIGATLATALYGELGGLAIFLVVFPTTLTYSLSVSLVPAVSEAFAQKNNSLIHQRLNQSLRLSLISGAPFSVIFIIFAVPLCSVLFDAPQVGPLLQIIAPFSLFLYFQAPLAAMLQGLGMAKAAFYNSLFGAIVKTGMIFLLGSRPELGIRGVALALNIGMTLVTLLHFFSVIQHINYRPQFLEYSKVIGAAILMGILGNWTYTGFVGQLPDVLSLGLALLVCMLLYTIFLVLFKALGKQDIERIPVLGKWFSPFFPYR